MRLMYRFLAASLLLAGLAAQPAQADDKLRGCLTGTKDNYILKTADGNVYRLHSDGDIKEHVGQMVEVKGHIDNKARDKEAAQSAASAKAAGVTIPAVGIDVHDIDSLGAACTDMTMQKADAGKSTVAVGEGATTTTTTTTTTTKPESGVAAGAQAGVAAGQSGVSAGVTSGTAGVSGTAQEGVATESGKYEHFTGCLTGTNDNYVLRADDGTLFRVHSDKDIHEHVGDRVDIRGRIDNKKREREAQQNVNSEAQAGVEVPKMGINVEDIKTITKGCESSPR